MKHKKLWIYLAFLLALAIPNVYADIFPNPQVFGNLTDNNTWTGSPAFWDAKNMFDDLNSTSHARCENNFFCWATATYDMPNASTIQSFNIYLDDISTSTILEQRNISVYNFNTSTFDQVYNDDLNSTDVNVSVTQNARDYLDEFNRVTLNITTFGNSDNRRFASLYIENVNFTNDTIVTSPIINEALGQFQNLTLSFTTISDSDTSFDCNVTINGTTRPDFTVSNNTVTTRSLGQYSSDLHNMTISCDTDETILSHSVFRTTNNFIKIRALDEKTPSTSILFNVTITNGTTSFTSNNNNLFFENCTNSALPVGSLIISTSSENYTSRNSFNNLACSSGNPIDITQYLLQSSDSLIVRFHLVTVQDTPIVGATVTAFRSIGGAVTLVEQATSDSSGTATLNLDSTASYTIEASHSQFIDSNSTIQPSSQDFTIVMLSTTAETPATEQLTNITYSITPQGNVTDITNELFDFTINSFDDSLQWFFFNVSHDDVELFTGNNTASASGGNLTTVQDLSSLEKDKKVVVVAMFRKSGVDFEFTITNSYFIGNTSQTVGTDLISISNSLRTSLGLDDDNNNKMFIGVIIIFLSAIGASIAGASGSGMLSLIIIGMGIFLGLMSFGVMTVVIFTIMVLAFLAIVFLRSGI